MLRTRRPLLALIALIALLVIGYVVKEADSGSGHGSGSSQRTVAMGALPVQARQTIRAIQHGGPFQYSQDGEVFRNDQHLLPTEPRGYYHEYTVPTPGESTRGARRIIAGKKHEYYYTADHYASFRRVAINQ
jgi:ribonuclease T1